MGRKSPPSRPGTGEYEVGYRKPPKHTQFKPGQSGNPKGYKKHLKSLKTLLMEALNERILVTIPIRSWLERLAEPVRTVGITPAIAAAAVALPASFPGDPTDRLIYATAVEHGWRLVTKDRRLRQHRHPRPVTVW